TNQSSNRSPLQPGTEIFAAETRPKIWLASRQRPIRRLREAGKSPQNAAILRRHPTKFEPWRPGGGRTRARTWDPMIKSHLLSHYLKRLHWVAEIDHHKSTYVVRIVVRDFLTFLKCEKCLILL